MLIEEHEVTAAALAALFNKAYMDTHTLKADSFFIKGESIPFLVKLDEDRKILKFIDFTVLRGISEARATALANDANQEFVFAKFYVYPRDDGGLVLMSEHDLLYQHGIIDYHLVSLARRFERIVGQVLAGKFGDYLS